MNNFDDEDETEREHFNSIVATFKYYSIYCMKRLNKTQRFINNLPASHQVKLSRYTDYLKQIKQCIEANDQVIRLMIKDVETLFQNVTGYTNPLDRSYRNGTSENYMNGSDNVELEITGDDDTDVRYNITPPMSNRDVDKVQTVLKQLVRDWGTDGAREREQCYKPIIEEIKQQFPPDKHDTSLIKVLVPGAGLGRLAWEIAVLGYSCQGNEFSAFMLFGSNFMLNKCTQAHVVYPWVHQYVNNLSCDHQVAPSRIPDVTPACLPMIPGPRPIDMSMTAGDFLKVYKDPAEWHCVATCFFIDCASNVIQFIETIYKILKPGGVWINLGPLLYHYSDLPNEDSIEPPYDILCDIIRDVGFVFQKSQTGVKTRYAQNPHSMLQLEYESVFFVCRKPIDDNDVIPETEDEPMNEAEMSARAQQARPVWLN